MPPILLALLLVVLLPAGPAADPPSTAAERSGFTATTSHDEVIRFLQWADGFDTAHLTSFGLSYEGRDLPLLIVGTKGVDPDLIKGDERLRVLVLANIHAGEVAGKEASLMMIRDLLQEEQEGWTDEMILLFAPNFNADGNERISPENRPLQHGPIDGMGTRSNAQELNINRDFEKLDTPEARAFADLMATYDPHLVLDLHTTNGTVHAYHLTYAPPLHPMTNTGIDRLLRENLLPAVQDSMQARGFRTFEYGNDKPEWGQPPGWATFDPRPRFLTNYVGSRNRAAIISEAYSYSPFEERIEATRAFVESILNYVAEHPDQLRAAVDQAERDHLAPGTLAPTRSAGNFVAEPEPVTILLGDKIEEINPHSEEVMWLRTDDVVPTEMTAYLRFAGSDSVEVPRAYLVPADLDDVLERLAAHGVEMHAANVDQSNTVERFRIRHVTTSERLFEGRTIHEVDGNYERTAIDDGAPSFIAVPVEQPLGRLVFLLLEPRSDAGFASWGLLETAGEFFPILRIPASEPPH